MHPAPRMAFSHMGLYVSDMVPMVDFYTGVLGFSVTDRANIRGVDVVFLSRSPDEHHQIVLVPGRVHGGPSTVNQISFRVISIGELRRVHAQLEALDVNGLNPTNHGGSWSIYFLDPEGNRIELFAPTPWYVPPISIPLDLSLSDDDIYKLTEELVHERPGHLKREEWRSRLRDRLVEEGTIEQRVALASPDETPEGQN
jgi:catechol 2,3-dioxygenase